MLSEKFIGLRAYHIQLNLFFSLFAYLFVCQEKQKKTCPAFYLWNIIIDIVSRLQLLSYIWFIQILFKFVVLLTKAHLRPGIFNMNVELWLFIEIYMQYRYIYVIICINRMTYSSNQYVNANNECCLFNTQEYHIFLSINKNN